MRKDLRELRMLPERLPDVIALFGTPVTTMSAAAMLSADITTAFAVSAA